MVTERISAAVARRIALAAQGFGRPRPSGPINAGHMARVLGRIGLFQIDSVNVLARAHYLPLFSRAGAYPRRLVDEAAWGRPRRLFEYWGHAASLMPLELQPLLRWRMAQAERGERVWGQLKAYAGERRGEAEKVLARIAAEGPLATSDFEDGKGRGGWWEWGQAKTALEYLFWAGRITTATRRNSFARVYDLTERVIPPAIMAVPTPDQPAAQRALIAIAARALGVATALDLGDYFRILPEDARIRIAELVEEGALVPVEVAGWDKRAFLDPAARRPRRIEAQALLVPFDPLIWERSRAHRLFGLHYRIGIYTPADQRTHGYYVLPFLMDEAIVARVDLKSDREARVLRVQSSHAEPGAPAATAERLAAELWTMAHWLELDDVVVAASGDLAPALAGRVRAWRSRGAGTMRLPQNG